MSNEKQESLADIVADMRQGMNPNGTAECQYLESDICTLADRIEAAAKREREAVGNAAKMRKALEGVRDWLVVHNAYVDTEREIVKLNAALAEPPRNCDVWTADKQEIRFSAFCLAHRMQSEKGCKICPCHTPNECSCEFVWSQMPYESGVKE